jgi:hypothetical protein
MAAFLYFGFQPKRSLEQLPYTMMKKIYLLFFVLSLSSICAQTSAIQYYNTIISEHTLIFKKNKRFITSVVHTEKPDEVETSRLQILGQIDSSLAVLSRMVPNSSDDQLRKETLEILRREREVYILDFKQVVNLKRSSAENFEAMERFFLAEDSAEARVNTMMSELRSAQVKFAVNNHLTIQENEKMQEQIDRIRRLNDYTEKVFLSYFRAFRDFNKLADAINTKKADEIERARLDLLSSAGKGVAKMKAAGFFENDSAYVQAGIHLLSTYEKLANGDMLEVARLLKEPSKLTNQDITSINSILTYMNEAPEELSLEFQRQERKLFQLHVPKD